mgnify:FL=1
MLNVQIRKCTVGDVEQCDALAGMLSAYGRESSIPEIGESCANMAMYHMLEASGALHILGAFVDGQLVGMASLMINQLPHYAGRTVAVTESLFVAPEHRPGGTGMQLLRAVEAYAKDKGAVALLVSAPSGGRLTKVLPRSGYRESNQVFVRGLQ